MTTATEVHKDIGSRNDFHRDSTINNINTISSIVEKLFLNIATSFSNFTVFDKSDRKNYEQKIVELQNELEDVRFETHNILNDMSKDELRRSDYIRIHNKIKKINAVINHILSDLNNIKSNWDCQKELTRIEINREELSETETFYEIECFDGSSQSCLHKSKVINSYDEYSPSSTDIIDSKNKSSKEVDKMEEKSNSAMSISTIINVIYILSVILGGSAFIVSSVSNYIYEVISPDISKVIFPLSLAFLWMIGVNYYFRRRQNI